MLCDKIDERFKKVAAAFRFFDLRSTGKISFADFSYIIDQLSIKFTRQQVMMVFQYLDKDKDGSVTYNDFCELCEERRRQIDPFDSIVQKVKDRQNSRMNGSELHSTYQKDFNSESKDKIYISKEQQEYKVRKENTLRPFKNQQYHTQTNSSMAFYDKKSLNETLSQDNSSFLTN